MKEAPTVTDAGPKAREEEPPIFSLQPVAAEVKGRQTARATQLQAGEREREPIKCFVIFILHSRILLSQRESFVTVKIFE